MMVEQAAPGLLAAGDAAPGWPRALSGSAALHAAHRLADRLPERPSWRSDEQEARRAALLDAAETMLADKGLLQTSIQEIGAALGLPPYAVRAQFGNREMVVAALLDRHLDRLIDRIGVYQAAAEGLAPGERLELGIAVLLDLLWAYRAGQRVHVAAVSGAPPALARSLRLRQRHLVHYYAGLIAAAVPEAAGRTELVMPAALNLMGMACWHVLWFREAGALGRADLARFVAHMVVDGVRAAAAAGVGAWDAAADGAADGG